MSGDKSKLGGNVSKPERHAGLTWEVPKALDVDASASAMLGAFAETTTRHLRAIVNQLQLAGGLDLSHDRMHVLADLAEEAAGFLSPSAMTAHGDIDPTHYLKIKKIWGSGAVGESYVVDGIACRKNVAHKRMPTHVVQPRIAVVGSAIESQKTGDTLSSFDTLLDQEQQHLENIVDHIISLNPHVLLVGKSVARYAQDRLLKHGIALVLNVKNQVLQRIALCTGAEVASSAEALSTRSIGFCKEFKVESTWSAPVDEPSSPEKIADQLGQASMEGSGLSKPSLVGGHSRPLMIFRGCPRPLGATILIHGRDARELVLLKTLVRHATKAAYMARLEAAFFSEEIMCAAALEQDTSVISSVKADATAAVEECSRQTKSERGSGAILSSSPFVSNFCEQGSARETALDVIRSSMASVTAGPHILDFSSREDAQSLQDEQNLSPEGTIALLAEAMYRLWLTISCKNPSKGILCEPAHSHCMHMYNAEDLPLGAFLSCAAPPDVKCFQPACRDGAVLHLRSFMRGNSLITLSCVRLSPEKSFKGNTTTVAADGQVWLWLRPTKPSIGNDDVRRVALSPDSACLSLAHLLSLLLDVRSFTFRKRNLQTDFIRYIASGDIIICLHHSLVAPMSVCFPPALLAVVFETQIRQLRDDLKKLTEEFDDVMSVVQNNVLSRSKAADEGDRWPKAVQETKTTAMKSIRQLQMDVDIASSTQQDGAIVGLVWQVNKLRKALAWVVHKWAFLLNELPSPPPILQNTEDAETVEDPAISLERSSTVTTLEKTVKPRSGNQSPQREPPPASRHVRRGSDSIAGQFTTSFGEKQIQEAQKYSAPSLRADPSARESALGSSQEAVPDPTEEKRARRLIPTGLVARYVSLFQDDTKGTPPRRLASRSWNGPEWATSIRGRSEDEVAGTASTSITNFEITDRDGYGFGSTKSGDSPRAVRIESVTKQFEELASSLDDLQPSATARDVELAQVSDPSESAGPVGDVTTATVLGRAQRFSSFLSGRPLLPVGADGVQITIFDEEPTSIVAYALATSAYKTYIEDVVKSMSENTGDQSEDAPSPQGDPSADLIDASRRVLFSESAQHCHFAVHDGSLDNSAIFQITAYFAPQFHQFRSLVLAGGEQQFLASISRCRKWNSKGGKSNVYFAKTRDDRYVVKQLSKPEKQFILNFIPPYFKYLSAARQHGQESCLARIVGLFQVSVQYSAKDNGSPSPFGVKDTALDLLVMENIFYNRDIQRVYDLKGSERDRYTDDDPRATGTVLLDENLKEINLSSPTVVGPEAFSRLQRAIWSDTGFLSNLGVMDYSLLVGVDKRNCDLVVGVIDFIRQFTLDKALEMYVKKAGILGGGGKDPTVLSPRHYSNRFRAAMSSWLTAVPDGTSGIEEFTPPSI